MNNRVKEIIKEVTHEVLSEEMLLEFGMKAQRMTDKYGEVLGDVVDNLICICIYPDNLTIPHWKNRAGGLCRRFAEINIEPIKKNTFETRYKALTKAIDEIFDKDFGALKNHFKSIKTYYANRPNTHDRILPYKPIEECYTENKDKIINTIFKMTEFVAKQDYESLILFINDFS